MLRLRGPTCRWAHSSSGGGGGGGGGLRQRLRTRECGVQLGRNAAYQATGLLHCSGRIFGRCRSKGRFCNGGGVCHEPCVRQHCEVACQGTPQLLQYPAGQLGDAAFLHTQTGSSATIIASEWG